MATWVKWGYVSILSNRKNCGRRDYMIGDSGLFLIEKREKVYVIRDIC